MGGADQQVAVGGTGDGEEIVNISFPVGHRHHPDALGDDALGGRQSVQPALTLLGCGRAGAALVTEPGRVGITGPDLLIEHPQRLPIRADRQNRVHMHTLVVAMTQRTNRRQRGVTREIEHGGVLHGEHHWVRRTPPQRRVTVRRQQLLGRNPGVVPEAVGRLGRAPIPTRHRNRRGGAIC